MKDLNIHQSVPEGVLVTNVDKLLSWGRLSSLWYLLFGLACCAIELMQTGGPRADLDRFGAVPRATPRQADLLIVAGTVTLKMAERVKRLYEQMPEPKYVISMGSCSNCGGKGYVKTTTTTGETIFDLCPRCHGVRVDYKIMAK